MCFPGVEPRRCANAFTVSDPLLAPPVASCLSGCFGRPLYVAISILRKLPRDVGARWSYHACGPRAVADVAARASAESWRSTPRWCGSSPRYDLLSSNLANVVLASFGESRLGYLTLSEGWNTYLGLPKAHVVFTDPSTPGSSTIGTLSGNERRGNLSASRFRHTPDFPKDFWTTFGASLRYGLLFSGPMRWVARRTASASGTHFAPMELSPFGARSTDTRDQSPFQVGEPWTRCTIPHS